MSYCHYRLHLMCCFGHLQGETNGVDLGSGGGSDITEDVTDGLALESVDPQRRAAIKQLKEKVRRTMDQIKKEQKHKQGRYSFLANNVRFYTHLRIKHFVL